MYFLFITLILHYQNTIELIITEEPLKYSHNFLSPVVSMKQMHMPIKLYFVIHLGQLSSDISFCLLQEEPRLIFFFGKLIPSE